MPATLAAIASSTRAAPRRPYRAVSRRALPIQQFEVDLALREIDPAQSHVHRIAQLPAPAGALAHQTHAAVLEFPVVAGYGGDMYQPVDGHFLELHE